MIACLLGHLVWMFSVVYVISAVHVKYLAAESTKTMKMYFRSFRERSDKRRFNRRMIHFH